MVRRIPTRLSCWLLALGLTCPAAALAQARRGGQERVSAERSGVLVTREGQWLKLSTDIGNIRIFTQSRDLAPGHVKYTVRIEGDALQPDAPKLVEQFVVSAGTTPEGARITGKVPWRNYRGRLFVNYQVFVPQDYNLDIRTAAGNITTQDIDGQAMFVSGGGNLVAGRVGGDVRLNTEGGHISVLSVGGDLQAHTAGGHVNVGPVLGSAAVYSAGGHISVRSVQGTAKLETAGGNISLGRAGAGLTASTAGGRIDLGEAAGTIRARTAGGGIRVVRLAGPTQLETSGGSIYLTSVQGQVRALTAAGGITAWLAPRMRLKGDCQLEAANGDILVYIPRDLAITIEASVESSGHTIDAEPGLPLKMTYTGPGQVPRVVRGQATLNGGGEVLRVKAQDGNIKLKFSDTYQALYEKVYESQMKYFEQSREWEKMFSEQQRQIQEKMQQMFEEQKERTKPREQEREEQRSRMEEWRLLLREKISGRIPVDADVQNRKLVYRVKPQYPEAARQAGTQGVVWLQIMIDKEGKVEEITPVTGPAVLVEAAKEAVRHWRYSPTYLGERPVAVTTVVRLEFRLN